MVLKEKKKRRKYSVISSLVWQMKMLWRVDRRFVFYIFAGIPFAIVTPLVGSYFSKYLIDALGGGTPFDKLVLIVLGFIGLLTVLNFLKKLIDALIDKRRGIPTRIMRIEIEEFEEFHIDYENTEKQDYKEIYNYAGDEFCHGDCSLEFTWKDVSAFLISLLGIGTFGSLLGTLNPFLFIIVVLTSVSSYFTSRWEHNYHEKNKHNYEKEERKLGYINSLSENYTASKEIKLYGMENWINSLYRDYLRFVLMWQKKCNFRGLLAQAVSGVMSLLQNGAAYVVLVGAVIAGRISVGDFVFFFGVVGTISGFIQNIVSGYAQLCNRADRINYYRDLLAYPNRMNYGDGAPIPKDNVIIELKDVWFKYPGAEHYTLKGINLTISPGESLALVGMNGAGKTTLVKLICGFYLPTKGEVLINGKTVLEYNIHEYYSIISAVFQKIRPYCYTIFEFIANTDINRETAREDAIDALKKAGLYDKIMTLPNGLDNHLMMNYYDDGVDLSGGEMQKLALARAIYKGGAILILDEPTAALDPIAENRIYLQYHDLTKGKTSVYISHRLASTRFCDRIILLHQGTVAETGTHDELLNRNGKYAELFNVQAKYYKEGDNNA